MLKGIAAGALVAGVQLFTANVTIVRAQAVRDTASAQADADDAETSFNIAKAAAARGDLIGAIIALERVLQTNPGLANIKLELGLLYLRAGNADLARSYLIQAVDAPDAPPEAKTRARHALKSASGVTSRFGINGTLFTSTAYQTNPNGSPSLISVIGPGGTPVVLSSDVVAIPRGHDIADTIGGSMEIRLGLGGQHGNDMVVETSASGSRFGNTPQINTVYAGGAMGPRIFLGPVGATSGFIRPYVSVSYLRLGGADYFSSYGAGFSITNQLSISSLLSARFNWENRTYQNSLRRPAAAEQSGDYFSAGLTYTQVLSPSTRVVLGLLGERTGTRLGYWSYDGIGGTVRAARMLKVKGIAGLTFDAGFAYRYADYDRPDPLIDPGRSRRENRFVIDGGVLAPITRVVSANLRASNIWNNATLPNYRYRNFTITLGFELNL